YGSTVVVELLARRSTLARQGARALQALICGIEFGLSLQYHGLGRRNVALPQRNLRLGCRHAVHGLLMRSLCFGELGFECGDLHASQWLALTHEVAFLYQNFLDAPGKFGRHVDLRCFDTAVAACEAWAGASVTQTLPPVPGSQGDDGENDNWSGNTRPTAACGHGVTSSGKMLQVYPGVTTDTARIQPFMASLFSRP